jgi:hypothetical protein
MKKPKPIPTTPTFERARQSLKRWCRKQGRQFNQPSPKRSGFEGAGRFVLRDGRHNAIAVFTIDPTNGGLRLRLREDGRTLDLPPPNPQRIAEALVAWGEATATLMKRKARASSS